MYGGSVISVLQTNRFRKAFRKYPETIKKIIEEEIDKIISDPEIGEKKKGDLAYLRVHKIKAKKQQILLGYTWLDDRIELHLLYIGSHENFYRNAKAGRDSDLKYLK